METFALYLFKSVIWLSSFAMVYFLFLRNERFFLLKRYYLVSGILISFIFPFISIHYQVVLPSPEVSPVDFTSAGNFSHIPLHRESTDKPFDYRYVLMFLYLSGVLFFAFRLILHIRSVYYTINRANIRVYGPAKLIRAIEFSSPFSFFNYIFINPSVNKTEMEEILNHELVHVRQNHWFDLLIIELLRLLQWANPFVWIYTGFIRLNHEYLADQTALQRTTDPAIYKAALLNQLFRSQVISLTNSFNYSVNKNRFEMMKNIITSPYRKLKVLLVLPVFAVVFYSFAKPEYHYASSTGNPMTVYEAQVIISKDVKGIVLQQDGDPLPGAAIIVKGTTLGALTDAKGFFTISNVPEEAMLVVSYVGFKSMVVKPDFASGMVITMTRRTVNAERVNIIPPQSPPPLPPSITSSLYIRNPATLPPPSTAEGTNFLKVRSTSTPPSGKPLFVVDGFIRDIDLDKIDPNTIESISVIKDEYATSIYGEQAKNGVIIIKTKKYDSLFNSKMRDIQVAGNGNGQNADKDLFKVVEEMPIFPGGETGMQTWISDRVKYPSEAIKDSITGLVYVNFVVTSTGEIKNVTIKKRVHPLLDAEAIRVISNMPDWKPGSQNGKPVDVDYVVPVEFKLK